MHDLTKRILVALVGIPLITILIFLGQWYFFALVLIISLVAQWEFYQMQYKMKNKPQVVNGLLIGTLTLLTFQTGQWLTFIFIIMFFVLMLFIWETFKHRQNPAINIGTTLTGIVYIPLFLGTLILSRKIIDDVVINISYPGFKFVMILLVTIWICDTFAYGIGSKFGKHKLREKVSPKKTVEGAVAGLAGAILTMALVKYLNILPINWLMVTVMGTTIGLIGQAGDLVESWFKRNAAVKDSSHLLPGHGGMLDRFDSLIFLSPAMLVLVYFMF